MNQQKIGLLLKELRKEKGATQEEIAEVFSVSNRTVSRWENGTNMPDLDILIEIADYYHVDLRELLNGERKNNDMEIDKEVKETVLQAVDYTNTENEHHNKGMRRVLMLGGICLIISLAIEHTDLVNNAILSNIASFLSGGACGLIILGFFLSSRYGVRLSSAKQRIANKNK